MYLKKNNNIGEKLFILVPFLIVAIFFTCFGATKIVNTSMMPTFSPGDFVLTSKNDNYSLNDIIIFTNKTDTLQETSLIKRVIGLPEDHVMIENGHVYVNDIMEAKSEKTSGHLDVYVPEDCYFVLGDARANSIDSRDFKQVGFVEKSRIEAKVIAIIWPFNRGIIF